MPLPPVMQISNLAVKPVNMSQTLLNFSSRDGISPRRRRLRTLMEHELLLSEPFSWEGRCYLVQVYRYLHGHVRCSHMARTTLGPDDDIIVDGASVDDVLSKQQAILPLAILSRSI